MEPIGAASGLGLVHAFAIGLGIGVLAYWLAPGRNRPSRRGDAALGVTGALAAYALGHALDWYATAEAGPGGMASVVGALLVLVIARAVHDAARSVGVVDATHSERTRTPVGPHRGVGRAGAVRPAGTRDAPGSGA